MLDTIKIVPKALFNLIAAFRKKLPLLYFLLSRIFSMVIMLLFLGLAVFGLMELSPGDVVDNYVKSQLMNTNEFRNKDNIYNEEEIKLAKARLGLDKPFYVQYYVWLKKVFVDHDLGRSLISKAPITFLIKERLINSLILNLISLFFLTVFSFILGIYFSSKAGTTADIVISFVSMVFHAFPSMMLLILLQLFALNTSLFPVTAYPDFTYKDAPVKFVFSYTYHIALPLIGAFLGGIGGTLRMVRATMLDQIGQPYITALRSRGISEKRIYFNHAFRNTLNPYITSSANLIASLFSGSLILEIIFSYPGIGRLMYEAVLQEDIYLVMTNLMFISFLILLGMIISDLLLALVDPRIKYSNS